MIKICCIGLGGHGVQFMSMLLAKSAIDMEYNVTLIKRYGPESRGGKTEASIVIDKNPISNPVIKKCDYLVAFEKNGYELWKDRATKTIYSENANNMYMLGELVKEIDFPLDIVIKTMKKEISSKYSHLLESNIENLKKGYDENKGSF